MSAERRNTGCLRDVKWGVRRPAGPGTVATMSRETTSRRRPRLLRPALVACVLAALALPSGSVRAAVSATYTISGFEVWPTPTVATFVGAGHGWSGDVAAWRASIVHSLWISPSGTIDGGEALLYTSDRTRITGRFSGGTVTLVSEVLPCGDERHHVVGELVDVTRSDTGAVGAGRVEGDLVHHRTWLFGACRSYSASVVGTISLTF